MYSRVGGGLGSHGGGLGSHLRALPTRVAQPASLSASFKDSRKCSFTSNCFNIPENKTYLGSDNLFCGPISQISETTI